MNSLTKNFCLEEMIRSTTAARLGINNSPGANIVRNLRSLCQNILQPLRDAWGKPIVVTSGYRSPLLNSSIKGASNSDHLYGCAADIVTSTDSAADNRRLFHLAVAMMRDGRMTGVKQIIDEHNYNWIHISWQDGRTEKRNQVLHL